MPATYRNRLVSTISNTPGAAGALTISTAQSGYRTFVSGDNGLTFDVVIVDGTAWEVRTDCTYTSAGTSLSRGTLADSSTGGAITLTSAAVVTVTTTAAQATSGQTVLTQADRSANYGFYVESDGTNTQTITDATWTGLNGGASGVLRTIESNVGSVWSADAAGRFTPPAGRWLVGGCVTMNAVDTGQRLFAGIRKNGAAGNPHRLLARSGPASTVNIVGLSGCVVVEANGSDYFELVTYVDGSGTHATTATNGYLYFWGQYLGPVL
jgi:hypothetical protein